MNDNNVNDIKNIVFGVSLFFILEALTNKPNPLATVAPSNINSPPYSYYKYALGCLTVALLIFMILFWALYPKSTTFRKSIPLYTTTVKESFTNMIEGLDNSMMPSLNTYISSRYKQGNGKMLDDLINNYTIKDFYIMSTYNSLIIDSEQAYGRVDLLMLNYHLSQGVRWLDMCLFSHPKNPDVPVIANSTDKDNRCIKNTENFVLLQDAVNLLIKDAFNKKTVPNPNDPLFVMIRFSSCEDYSDTFITNLGKILDGIPKNYKPSDNYRYSMQNHHIMYDDINSNDYKIQQSTICDIIMDKNNLNKNINTLQTISESQIVTNMAFIPLYAIQQKILFVMDDSCMKSISNQIIQNNICSVFTNYASENGVLSSSSFLQTEKVNLSLNNDKNVILSATDIIDSVTNVESTQLPYINYSKMNILCAYPSFYVSNPTNSPFKQLCQLGCQVVPMRFFTTNPDTDSNLKDAINFFNNGKSAFILRPDTINVKTTCQEIPKQKYSNQTKTFSSNYPPSKFQIISNESAAASAPGFVTTVTLN